MARDCPKCGFPGGADTTHVCPQPAPPQRGASGPVTSQEVAEDIYDWRMYEFIHLPRDRWVSEVAAKIDRHTAALSSAVQPSEAQIRREEAKWWHGRGKPHLEGHDCHWVIENAVSFSCATVEECKHMVELERQAADP